MVFHRTPANENRPPHTDRTGRARRGSRGRAAVGFAVGEDQAQAARGRGRARAGGRARQPAGQDRGGLGRRSLQPRQGAEAARGKPRVADGRGAGEAARRAARPGAARHDLRERPADDDRRRARQYEPRQPDRPPAGGPVCGDVGPAAGIACDAGAQPARARRAHAADDRAPTCDVCRAALEPEGPDQRDARAAPSPALLGANRARDDACGGGPPSGGARRPGAPPSRSGASRAAPAGGRSRTGCRAGCRAREGGTAEADDDLDHARGTDDDCIDHDRARHHNYDRARLARSDDH